MIKKIKKIRNRVRHTLKRWKNRVYPTPAEFDEEALIKREEFRDDYWIIAESLSHRIDFQTVLDVGCAQGFLMIPLLEKGFNVQGIEISEDVMEIVPDTLESRITIGDFQKASGNYDLVCCVEVAEHIEPARSEVLVDKLCELSNQYIYFTAAPPTQAGRGHINCRPYRHWIDWFEDRGWKLRHVVTKKIRQDLDSVNQTEWLIENSFVFSSD